MKAFIYTLLATLIFSINGFSQTSLAGKVTDAETGEPILFGNVILYKGGNFLTGVSTDIDGFYNFANMDPGTYDVEFQYTNYKTTRINGMVVYGGQSNRLDNQLESGSSDEVIVIDYKVLFIKQDHSTCCGLTSEQLKKLPTRNITAIRATTAKCFPTKGINIKNEENQLVQKLPSRELNNTIQNLIDLQVRSVDF